MNKIIMRPLPFILLLASMVFAQQMPSSSLTVAGLKQEVTVRRDDRGIPYIQASSDADLYFAQGYITAGDRLWQMDLMRRLARGETAEIFGGGTLEEDKRWRRFGFSQIAEASLAELSPALRAALNDYARGVNAYIAMLDEKTMPVEFRILQYKPKEWHPTDTIVIGKILADALSTTWQNDLLRASLKKLSPEKFADLTNDVTPYDVVLFGTDTPAKQTHAGSVDEHPVPSSILQAAAKDMKVRADSLARVGLYAEDLAASNNWVISGKRTNDGKPILANDPHLMATAPGVWYISHLSSPNLRVAGVTFPGVPGIVLGHNENIAWGATNVGPDVQDVYYETFNARGEYKTPAGWEKPTVRKEKILVRNSPLKTETREVDYDVMETRNGVIVIEDSGKKYSLKWTARDPKNNEFEAFFGINRARNWNDFKSALKTYGGATQNFVYADVKGNIGWYAAGRIPIRRVGDGSMPYDGSTTEGDWTGYIPFDELPNLYDPPNGLIVTANQRIVGTSYKYTQMSTRAAPPWRARRVFDLLNSKTKITMDDVRDVQYDTYNIPLANLAKEFVASGITSQTTELFRKWNGKMTADSPAGLLADRIMGCMASRMDDDLMGVPSSIVRERVVDWALREKPARWLPHEFKTYGELLQSCDATRRTELANKFGTDQAQWLWGKVWQSRFPHPLAVVPLIGAQFATPAVPLDGSGQTPNVGSNVSMRFIASPGSWDATRLVIPLGESGAPASTHFKDQFEAWRTGSPTVFRFSQTAVQAAARETLHMTPPK
jgi:penicillin amidase